MKKNISLSFDVELIKKIDDICRVSERTKSWFVEKAVENYIKEKISKDPYCGNRLKGKYSSLWKYRVGDFRIIYTVKAGELKILIFRVRHRGCVYDDILF